MFYLLKMALLGAGSVCLVLLVDAALVFGFGRFQPEVKDVKKADAILVLGAAINTPALRERTLTGLELYQAGKAEVMVLSGGRISLADFSEAENMERIIKARDQKVKVFLDQDSHNTYESVKRARELLGPGKSLIVVSDEFHLARASLLAQRLGFGPVQWRAPVPSYYSQNELRRYYWREIAAMIGYIPRFIKG